MYIISQPGTKVKIIICTVKRCSRAERKSSELAGRFQEQKKLGLVSLRREISLIFGGGLHFNPSFEPEHASPGESETPQ